MNSKPTWEDVPAILAQILDRLDRQQACWCKSAAADAPVVVQAAEPIRLEQPATADRATLKSTILGINRNTPELRAKVTSIIASLTPNGDGKFNDVPDSKLSELQAQIEALRNEAA